MEKFRIIKITVKSNNEFRSNSINEMLAAYRHHLNLISGELIGNNWLRKSRKHLHPTALLTPDLSIIAPSYQGTGFDETEKVVNLHLHGYLIIPIKNTDYDLLSRMVIPDRAMTHKIPGYGAFRVWTEKYDFDGRNYDGYIQKSLNRLSDFGDQAFFGYVRKPCFRKDVLMNDLRDKSLVVLSEYAGVELSQDEKALI